MMIGWFSCGITSAVACKLAIDKFGKDAVKLFYMEIDTAHSDNDRFIQDCERWYGIPIERVSNGKYKNQFDVIDAKGHINSPFGAPCTTELKKKVRWKIESDLNYPPQIFGFEYAKNEINRAVRFTQQYPMSRAVFPLIEMKLTKEMCAGILIEAGIALPKMYELGFHNNNCIGCVKGGKAYWNKIRDHFPEVFEKMALTEREIERSCINGTYLDELNPGEGRFDPPILPDCGTFCEIKYADVHDPISDIVYEDPTKISLVYDRAFF